MALKLKNGAEIISKVKIYDSVADYVVLAESKSGEYVTWVVDAQGVCHWGHYFNDNIGNAMFDFR